MRFTPLFAATTIGGQVCMLICACDNRPWLVFGFGGAVLFSAFMLGWVARVEERGE